MIIQRQPTRPGRIADELWMLMHEASVSAKPLVNPEHRSYGLAAALLAELTLNNGPCIRVDSQGGLQPTFNADESDTEGVLCDLWLTMRDRLSDRGCARSAYEWLNILRPAAEGVVVKRLQIHDHIIFERGPGRGAFKRRWRLVNPLDAEAVTGCMELYLRSAARGYCDPKDTMTLALLDAAKLVNKTLRTSPPNPQQTIGHLIDRLPDTAAPTLLSIIDATRMRMKNSPLRRAVSAHRQER